jgi:hypothetical protein
MKKIIYTILLSFIMLPQLIQAQTEEAGAIGNLSSYPVVYNYDEQVVWYFDLSTTTFTPNEEIYLWIWSPSEPDAGNWENSSDFAKLKYEGNLKWSISLTPTQYFAKTSQEIAASAGFWLRLKNKTGTKQTDVVNMKYVDFSSFYTDNEMIRSYPMSPTIDAGISILFNSNLVAGFDTATSVHFHSGLNDWSVLQEYQSWLPDIVEKTKLKNLGNGFYKMDLIPSQYYGTAADFVMKNIVFILVKDDWAGTSASQVIYAGEYIAPPPPEFMFFPLQISQKDFLGIIRKNNEVGVNKLIYTISAGTKIISGEFSGGVSEIKGFVNLVSELKGIENLTEVHVLVKDNKGTIISDTTIPLKKLD